MTTDLPPERLPLERLAVDPVTEAPWHDLADNRPGEQARQQAVAAKQAAPIRSVLARILLAHTDERAWVSRST